MKPKLIVIYGFAGVGKTTLAKKLTAEMPMAICLEEDEILGMIGQWLKDENKARGYVYQLMKAMVETYLKMGQSVVIPYLLTEPSRAVELEALALKTGAMLVELYVKVAKEAGVAYLYERGTWGESGSPPITKKDRAHIEAIYDEMAKAMETRTNCITVPYERGNIDKVYLELRQRLGL